MVIGLVALALPAAALATQFFSGNIPAGGFAQAAGFSADSDQTQKNSGSGCALTFFNTPGSNIYQFCSNMTFTVSAQSATGHDPAANPACGAKFNSVNVTCRWFTGF